MQFSNWNASTSGWLRPDYSSDMPPWYGPLKEPYHQEWIGLQYKYVSVTQLAREAFSFEELLPRTWMSLSNDSDPMEEINQRIASK